MKTLFPGLLLLVGVCARAQTAPASWQRLDGQHSGIKRLLAVAISDPGKWGEVWREHGAAAPLPAVDFTQESVVAIFLGETRTAGVTVRVVVSRDPLDASRLNVLYRGVAAKKPFAADVICEPYAIVKVRRAAVIDVEADARVGTPERRVDPRKIRALSVAAGPSFDGR